MVARFLLCIWLVHMACTYSLVADLRKILDSLHLLPRHHKRFFVPVPMLIGSIPCAMHQAFAVLTSATNSCANSWLVINMLPINNLLIFTSRLLRCLAKFSESATLFGLIQMILNCFYSHHAARNTARARALVENSTYRDTEAKMSKSHFSMHGHAVFVTRTVIFKKNFPFWSMSRYQVGQ